MDPLAPKVLARFLAAGYSGWDPPEPEEDPDPSEMWDELVDQVPHSMQDLFKTPKEHKSHSSRNNQDSVTYEVELDLGDDLGGTLTVEAYEWEDADEDGRYGESGVKVEYYLVAGDKTWDGKSQKYDEKGVVRDFKRDFHQFVEVLKRDHPDIAKKYKLR